MRRRRPRVRLEDVGVELLTKYIRGRAAFKSKATLASVVSRLRLFGELLVEQGIWVSNPMRWMRGPKCDPRARVPRRIGKDALRRLWGCAAERGGEYRRTLWVTLLAVLYGTGLRRGELERLDVTDWNPADGTLLIDGRKTGQERRVPVPETVWRCLEAYLPKRHNHLESLGAVGETALFVNRDGGRLACQSISVGMKRIATRSGSPGVTLHQFRHTCASDLLERGTSLPEVQEILGHRTIQTTVRYLSIADPQRHEAVKRHPINEILGGTQ